MSHEAHSSPLQPGEACVSPAEAAGALAAESLLPKEVPKLLFLSFRHSQGSPDLQQWLFDYVYSVSGQQPLSSAEEQGLRRSLSRAIQSYFRMDSYGASTAAYHTTIQTKLVAMEVKRTLSLWRQANERSTPLTRPYIMRELTSEVVSRDAYYLLQHNGRARAAGESPCHPVHHDPFFSFIGYYALEGHATGLAVLDRLYGDVKTLIEQSQQAKQGNPSAEIAAQWLLNDKELKKIAAILSK